MFFEQYDHEPNIAVARFWLTYAPNPERYADDLPGLHDGGYRALGRDGEAPRRRTRLLRRRAR